MNPSAKHIMTSLEQNQFGDWATLLQKANEGVRKHWPGEPASRQPVHTIYGGAQLYKAGSSAKLGKAALKELFQYAPDFVAFAKALRLPQHETLPVNLADIELLSRSLDKDPEAVRLAYPSAYFANLIYRRVVEKLEKEPIEDQRIDFEDGYGNRPDEEEDHHASVVAKEVAIGYRENSLPPFLGIRIKSFTDELLHRSIRTVDLVITNLIKETNGHIPSNFVVTLPKITSPEHVTVLVQVLEQLEAKLKLAPHSLKMEMMIEVPQSILNERGESQLPLLLNAAKGRCVGAHFGTYDYTASVKIAALHQHMGHAACDFAKHMMQIAFADTGIFLSDGATNVMPVPIHRVSVGSTLSDAQLRENRDVVHRAWKLHYDNVMRSMVNGYYQGWDLHPAQLPSRYAAVFSFFFEALPSSLERLTNFMAKAAQATLVGDVFDDAATGQGLLNFFLRGIASGALTEADALKTGLTIAELRSRSFVQILNQRRNNGSMR